MQKKIQKAATVMSCGYLICSLFSPLIVDGETAYKISNESSVCNVEATQVSKAEYESPIITCFKNRLKEKVIVTSNVLADEDEIPEGSNNDSIIETETYEQELEVVIEPYVEMATPSNNSFKSYMGKNTITDKSSSQYNFLQSSYTDESTGIMMVDGRYCIAVGSYYTSTIGTYIDLVMENGSVIPCVLADQKSDAHTDSTHRQNFNGSISEFIVNESYFLDIMYSINGTNTGNVQDILPELQGEIACIRVYQ